MPKMPFFVLFFCLLLAGSATASPLAITYEEYGEYLAQQGLFRAAGHVELQYEDGLMQADELIYDLEEGILYLSGQVYLQWEDSSLRGGQVRYNLNTGHMIIDEAGAAFRPRGFTEDVYLRGHRMELDENLVFIASGSVTTCDLSSPHYRLEAKEILIYPDDRLVVKGVTYREGNRPLFYWPYLVIPLREDYRFRFPQIGRGEDTGWFIKTAFDYHRPGGSYGTVEVDYFQHQGIGLGLGHTYVDDDRRWGRLYVYQLLNYLAQGGRQFAWQQEFYGQATTLGLDYQLEQDLWGQLEHNLLTWIEARTNTSQTYGFVDYRFGVEREYDIHLRHDARWPGGWRLRGHGSLDETGDLEYLAHLERAFGAHTIFIAAEERLNLDDEEVIYWYSVRRRPELGWQWRLSGALSQLSWGHYVEAPAGTAAYRLNWEGRLFNRHFPLAKSLTLWAGGQTRASLYSTGEEQYVLEPHLGLQWRPWSLGSFQLDYRGRSLWGNSPFWFDRPQAQQDLTGRLQLGTGPWRFNLAAGYDFWWERWQPVRTSLSWSGGSWRLGLQSSYRLETNQWETLTALVEGQPREDVKIQLGARYHLENQTLERLEGALEIPLTANWHLQYLGSYDVQTEELNHGQLALTWRLHCREIRWRWDQEAGEVWVEYALQAFPQGSLSLGGGPEGMMFDSQGWQELMELP
ncbi:MAG: DUF3769 domain-containing protein [Limnochordia bacterium]|jgi:hypothetical protein